METILIYFGKVAVAMAAFYLVFLILFQNQKHFGFNRIYLLASMAVSYLIPLITFTITRQVEVVSEPVIFRPEVIESLPAMVSYAEPFRWQDYMFWGFLAGAGGFLIYFLSGNLKAIRMVNRCRKSEDFGFTFWVTNEDVHPFSFFNRIIVPAKVLKHRDLKLILAHENIHVEGRHTADILVAELLFLGQWFNPFAWLMKDAVKNNLEYTTDDIVTKQNDRETYQLAMVSMADKRGVAPFLNALNGSQLKNRIVMMKKTKQNRFTVVKQLAIVPLLTLLIIGLSNKEFKAEVVKSKPVVQNQEKTRVIRGKVTDEKGKPLAGVNLIIYENDSRESRAKRGVTTNKNGEYVFEIESGTDIIFCSMIGYKDQNVTIGDKTIINISLKKGEKPLYIVDGKEVENIDNIPASEIESMEVLKDKSATILYGEKGKNGVLLITTKKGSPSSKEKVKPVAPSQESEVFYIVEEMPEFPGGDAALREYIKNTLKYPAIAKENGIQGKVYVSFVVDSLGNISNAKVARSVDPSLDKEALRIVNSLPRWKPGKQRGRAVNVSFTAPVNFTLGDQTGSETIPIERLSAEELKKRNSAQIEAQQESEVFYIVEEMPEFPGGDVALRRFIAENLKYPVDAQEKGIQGKVYISFVVDSLGNVIQPKISRSVDPLLDAEALRVVTSLPRWKPGKQRGKAVNVSFTVPVTFALQDGSNSNPSEMLGKRLTDPQKPLLILDGNEIDNLNDIDQSKIESMTILKDQSGFEKYGDKAKNGVIVITSKSAASEVVTTELELRKYIGRELRYPSEAQKNNITGKVELYYKIDSYGKKTLVPKSEVRGVPVPIDEVVVTAIGYKNSDNTDKKSSTQDLKLLEDEAKRATRFFEIHIPEYYGKTIRITIIFALN